MALIKCPECRNELSDKANFCPHCGYPLGVEKFKSSFPTSLNWGILLAIGLLILGFVMWWIYMK